MISISTICQFDNEIVQTWTDKEPSEEREELLHTNLNIITNTNIIIINNVIIITNVIIIIVVIIIIITSNTYLRSLANLI